MIDAVVIFAFLFFLGLACFMGLAGRSFWFIPIVTLFTFAALNLYEVIGPNKVDSLANTVGLSVLTYLIYLVPIAVAFLCGYAAHRLSKASFGDSSASVIEWGLIIIVAVSLFAAQAFWVSKPDNSEGTIEASETE